MNLALGESTQRPIQRSSIHIQEPRHAGYGFPSLLDHLSCMPDLLPAQLVWTAYVLSPPPGCLHPGL